MKVAFTSTVGDDIYVIVTGDHDRPDASVGYEGSCQIETVCLPDSTTDLSSLLSQCALDRLELEGMAAAQQQKADAVCDAAEARRQSIKDNYGE